MYIGNDSAPKYQTMGSTLGQSVGQFAESPRKPEVEAEMDRLAGAVDTLAKIAESLSVRLEPIRRPTGNGIGAATGNGAPQPVQCTMAAIIRDRREAVERYTQQLATVLSELEI